MPSVRTGIVYQPHGQTTIEHLLLEDVSVKAWVVDVSSRVILTQTFYNPSEDPTGRAKYVFPLPANAAVCAFQLELEDGSLVVGEVKEKDEAAQTFSRAVEQGKAAALVERVTDDIFMISVGSIPATARVTARLTFVMDLLSEALTDHIRFQLPLFIAERYGAPPPEMQDSASANPHTRLHVCVDVQTSGVIHHIRSLTHQIRLRRYMEHSGRKSERRMSAVWESPEFLTSDFVLTIHAEGLDRPRCFAEVFRVAGSQEATVAMQLTLVPKFQTSRIPSQEYIFVVDRSGSMSGNKIETAKHTLNMLLRLLPSTQTTFSIFSFGTDVTNPWDSSRALTPVSLAEATSHVTSMSADHGGTEIPKALRKAFNSRARDRPTVVFLLTDGQLHTGGNLDPYAVISNAVQSSPREAPVRLFVLGIGNDVSQDVCSGLARHGNGEALFAVSAEEILGKCASLVNAGRSKNIESIDIDWGYDASSPAARPTTLHLPPNIPVLDPPPPLQQAPHSLTRIFSGFRFTVFVITSFKTVPTSVRLVTKLAGDPDPQESTVHITKVKPFRDVDEDMDIPIVHTLGARRLITDLDDGVGPLPSPASEDALLASEEDLRKAGIIRLGLTYHLVSKHTSFVAVQKGTEQRMSRGRGRGRGSRAWAKSRLAQTDPDTQESSSVEAPTFLDDLISGVSSLFASVFGFLSNPVATPSSAHIPTDPRFRHRPGFPGAYSESNSDAGQSKGRRSGRTSSPQQRRSRSSDRSAYTFSSLSSLEESSCSSCWTSSRSPSPLPRFQDPIERAPSPEFIRDTNAPNLGVPVLGQDSSRKRHPIPPVVYELFRGMAVDGSLTATPLLSQLVGDAVLGKADELGIDKTVWTTVVFVAYVRTQLQDEPDLLDLMSEKAKAFVEASEWARRDGTRRFEEMVAEAMAALPSP